MSSARLFKGGIEETSRRAHFSRLRRGPGTPMMSRVALVDWGSREENPWPVEAKRRDRTIAEAVPL